ncbi:MAG: tetratricopeptide repeat protein, partial [Terriglobia bacterium]
ELTENIQRDLNLAASADARGVAEVSSASLEAYRLYTSALEAHRNLRLADARDLYLEAVQADPSFASAYYQLAGVSFILRDSASAEKYRQKTDELKDHLPERLKLLFEAREEEDRQKQAAILEELISRYPDEEEAYFFLARSYDGLGETGKALEAGKRGVEALPKSGSMRNNYGYALLARGRYVEALRELETYASLEPSEPNPHDSLAEAYLITGQPEKALKGYARSLEVDPTFWPSHHGRAWAYAMLGRYPEAWGEVKKAQDILVQANIPLTNSYALESMLLSRMGRYRAAEQTIQRAIRVTEETDNRFLRGVFEFFLMDFLIERGEYAAAISRVDRAEKVAEAIPDQQFPDPQLRWDFKLFLQGEAAIAEVRADRLAAAKARLESMKKLPASQQGKEVVRMVEGEVALAEGDLAAAETIFTPLEPDLKADFSMNDPILSFGANRALNRDRLARVKKARGDLRGAIDGYRKLLTPDIGSKWVAPLEPLFVLELARLLAEAGDTEAAKAEYVRFLELWQEADSGLPALRAAKAEYAKLQ